ncbi:hypothetical protein DSO57_1014480 [Entomophthora muscae]|nr:hypothetical protein DSO57_1014480 [Entomophthora muscae]
MFLHKALAHFEIAARLSSPKRIGQEMIFPRMDNRRVRKGALNFFHGKMLTTEAALPSILPLPNFPIFNEYSRSHAGIYNSTAYTSNPWRLVGNSPSIEDLSPRSLEAAVRNPATPISSSSKMSSIVFYALVDGLQCGLLTRQHFNISSHTFYYTLFQSPPLFKHLLQLLLSHGNIHFALNMYAALFLFPDFTARFRQEIYEAISLEIRHLDNGFVMDLGALWRESHRVAPFLKDPPNSLPSDTRYGEIVEPLMKMVLISSNADTTETRSANKILFELNYAGEFKRFNEALNTMLERGVTLDAQSFSLILNSAVLQHDRKMFLDYFGVLIRSGYQPETAVCNSILKFLAKFSGPGPDGLLDLRLNKELLAILEENLLKPDKETARIIFPLLDRHPDEVVRDFLAHRIIPRLDYSCATVRAMSFSHELHKMKLDDPEFQEIVKYLLTCQRKAPLLHFRLVLEKLSQGGDMVTAKTLFKRILDHGLLDGRCFDVMMNGHIKERDLSQALNVLEASLKQNIIPTPFTLHKLILGMDRTGRPDLAGDVFDSALEAGAALSYLTVNYRIHMLVRDEQMAAAIGLISKLDHDFSPSTCTYNTLLRGLLANRDTSGAQELLSNMRKKRIPLDSYTYVLILRSSLYMEDDVFARSVRDSIASTYLNPDLYLQNYFETKFLLRSTASKATGKRSKRH